MENEWREMGEVAGRYVRGGCRVSMDPLGFGLWAWKSQVRHQAAQQRRQLRASTALEGDAGDGGGGGPRSEHRGLMRQARLSRARTCSERKPRQTAD
jgi:hypothetical protein